MKKLKVQMQVSLDGFNSTGPNDAQQWVTWAWDEIKQDVLDLAHSCDTELIGRKLAVDYLPFWRETRQQPESLMYEAALIKARQRKIVFSQTLPESPWEDAELATGNLVQAVTRLKNETGKDLIVYGGSTFVANLVDEDLVDEFHLYINPIAIGKGASLFEKRKEWRSLQLIEAKTYPSGIVRLHYERL
jgi:dihydrofolate reductase